MLAYEIPLSWEPDPDLINSTVGINYLAWRIGTDSKRQMGLWWISAVTDDPVPLEDLIDLRYATLEFLADVPTYGYMRTIMPNILIVDLQAAFVDAVDAITNQVTDGLR